MRSLLSLTLLLPAFAFAAPANVPVQGVLADDSGAPLNGDYSVAFTLYDDATGANATWTSTRTVTFSDGFFGLSWGGRGPRSRRVP